MNKGNILLFALNTYINNHEYTPPSSDKIKPLRTKYNIIDYYYAEDTVTEAEYTRFFRKHLLKITDVIVLTSEQFDKMINNVPTITEGDKVIYFNTTMVTKVVKVNHKTNKLTVELPFKGWTLLFEENINRFKLTDEPLSEINAPITHSKQVLLELPEDVSDMKQILLTSYRLSNLYRDSEIIIYVPPKNKQALREVKRMGLPYTTQRGIPNSRIIITDDVSWCIWDDLRVYSFSEFLEPLSKHTREFYEAKYCFPRVKEHLLPFYFTKLNRRKLNNLKKSREKQLQIKRIESDVDIMALWTDLINRGEIDFAENLITFFRKLGIQSKSKKLYPTYVTEVKNG